MQFVRVDAPPDLASFGLPVTPYVIRYMSDENRERALECVALQHAYCAARPENAAFYERFKRAIPYWCADGLMSTPLPQYEMVSDTDTVLNYIDYNTNGRFQVTVRVSDTEKRGFYRDFQHATELLVPHADPEGIVLRVIPRQYERAHLASVPGASNVVYVSYNGAYTTGPPWDVLALRYVDDDGKHKLIKM